MIGVLNRPGESDSIREFFELFKTPWEFYNADRDYDVVLCSEGIPDCRAKLTIVYGIEDVSDGIRHIPGRSNQTARILRYIDIKIPVYNGCLTFPASHHRGLLDEVTGEPVAALSEIGSRKVLRVGFDLFKEVEFLLTQGQPISHARTPTLDLHVTLLRDFITRGSVPLVEIPPVPNGYSFTVCLTHDVDHAVLSNHRFDHTMFGFLYRATISTFVQMCRGRRSPKQFWQNLLAACSLPLVYLGAVRDYWRGFYRYLEIDGVKASTFFVLPYKNRPGETKNGRTFPDRAARYDVDDIPAELVRIASAGGELGLHGIDAWFDSKKGRDELNRISAISRTSETGVRMHWLFFDSTAPMELEEAGFDYDSTVGYNEVVGFRAGTSQVYRLFGSERLLELPLHIMDTALFYPDYLGLSFEEAQRVVSGVADDVMRFGGVLTVNWHDRSIAPERLWGDFYVDFVNTLRKRGAWLPTARQAVHWFRRRRSAVFENLKWDDQKVTVRARVTDGGSELPGLRVRLYWPQGSLSDVQFTEQRGNFMDAPLISDEDVSIVFEDKR